MLNYNHFEEYSHIYGPGVRAVIWFQGCKLDCKGCWNTEMLKFAPKNLISPENLALKISEIEGIQGISLLGGEPLNQDIPLLIDFLTLIKNQDLSIVLFTGYTEKQVPSQIVELVDILIVNPYIESQRTTNHYLIGSTNQEILFTSPRYSLEDMDEDGNYQEIIIDKSGVEHWLGFPEELS